MFQKKSLMILQQTILSRVMTKVLSKKAANLQKRRVKNLQTWTTLIYNTVNA